MPVVRELQAERRAATSSSTTLRPWDLAVDPLNRPPLRPFEQVDRHGVQHAENFRSARPRTVRAASGRCRTCRLLDLANRKGKAPGGYQSTLAEARLPFIFMNAVGLQRDVETILHEAGHAFHALATRDEDLHAYRSAPIEFCEVASMSMELLGNEFLEEFYAAPDANRARRHASRRHRRHFPLDRDRRCLPALDLHAPGPHARRARRCLGRPDGPLRRRCRLERPRRRRANLWHRQLHIFTHPFYYVEYGIAQLGALQVWSNSQQGQAARAQ